MSVVGVVWGSLDECPLLLTVEEAAAVLRIGRSLAYELARRYESSDGHEGLPVMRVGALMRVPRWALAELVATGRVVRLADLVDDSSASEVALRRAGSSEGRTALARARQAGASLGAVEQLALLPRG
jgi:excisionase family DNA binding protein